MLKLTKYTKNKLCIRFFYIIVSKSKCVGHCEWVQVSGFGIGHVESSHSAGYLYVT